MYKWLRTGVITVGMVFMAVSFAYAGESGHYVNGVEGIKASTLPPPGFYYRFYTVYYSADTMTDDKGDDLDVGFDLSVFALVNRFIWISNYKFLGADFGMDAVVPLIYTDLEIDAAGVSDDQFGLGDICLEPVILSWHGPQYDAAFGLAFYAPIGSYDVNEPASPGKDFWSVMFTLGGTAYFDQAKTWSASVLGRYETHMEKGDTKVTPGDDFHFEWGVGKP